MKQIAILLVMTVLLSGCGSSSTPSQTAPGSSWQLSTTGGAGDASGFSFIVQFTVNVDASLNITYFQFLTSNPCFAAVSSENGTLIVTTNAQGVLTGPFTFNVQASSPAGNSLTFMGNEDGTMITGSWTVAGSSSCTGNGSFTMTQS